MNKFIWFLTPWLSFMSTSAFATNASCTISNQVTFNQNTETIAIFPYFKLYFDNTSHAVMSSCSEPVAVRTIFRASSGNTDLTGNAPFSVNSNIVISGSTASPATLAAAKAWLVANLQIDFVVKDNSDEGNAVGISALDRDYNVLPNTAPGTPIIIRGESYYPGRAGRGLLSQGMRFSYGTIHFVNSTKPSADIISALNNATVRIHLGTFTTRYDNYRGAIWEASGVPKTASTEVFFNLGLNFNLATCTIANQVVDLAPISTGLLNSNQTGNEQNFNVNINCTASMSNKILLAKITDNYSPNNVNNNGILINQPRLANRSNVDIQLRDDTNTPLAIGTPSPFYSIPVGSSATTFSKALKARYYRSAATATPGYVQTQATIFLDYQ